MAVAEYIDGRLTNFDRLMYEAQVYLNWRYTGELPARLYDMPSAVMMMVFAIQSDVTPTAEQDGDIDRDL